MIKTFVVLSENQIKKIRGTYKKQESVKIYLSYEKIKQPGKYTLLLTECQKNEIDKKKH
jgi:hypothetical protein